MADIVGTESAQDIQSYYVSASVTKRKSSACAGNDGVDAGVPKKVRKAERQTTRESSGNTKESTGTTKVESTGTTLNTDTVADPPKIDFCKFKSLTMEEKLSTIPCIITDSNVSTLDGCAKFMLDDSRDIGGGRLEYRDGKAWIYEIPHICHGRAAGTFNSEVMAALGNHYRDVAIDSNPTLTDVNQDFSYEPDGAITVDGGGSPGPDDDQNRANTDGERYPNIIVEVAYSESQKHVQNKAEEWLRTSPTKPEYGVQQVIAIKIGSKVRRGREHGTERRTMKAFRYERDANNNPVQSIEFGFDGPGHQGLQSGGAHTQGLANMQIDIPTESIFRPLPVPDDLGDTISVDLYFIRRTIEEAFS